MLEFLVVMNDNKLEHVSCIWKMHCSNCYSCVQTNLFNFIENPFRKLWEFRKPLDSSFRSRCGSYAIRELSQICGAQKSTNKCWMAHWPPDYTGSVKYILQIQLHVAYRSEWWASGKLILSHSLMLLVSTSSLIVVFELCSPIVQILVWSH